MNTVTVTFSQHPSKMSKKRCVLGLNWQRDGKGIVESAKYAILLRVSIWVSHIQKSSFLFPSYCQSFFFFFNDMLKCCFCYFINLYLKMIGYCQLKSCKKIYLWKSYVIMLTFEVPNIWKSYHIFLKDLLLTDDYCNECIWNCIDLTRINAQWS